MVLFSLALAWGAGPAHAQTSPPSQAPRQIHTDKLLHAGASAAVVDVVWAGMAAADQPLWARLGVSVASAALVGLGKEAADLAGFGTADGADLLFDGFGIGLGVAVALLVETWWPAPATTPNPTPLAE